MAYINKPVRLLPIIHSIKDFLYQEHPKHHPDSKVYEEYWEEQERLCVEGKWGLDWNPETKEGGYRYMPPFLYYYINICKIIDEGEHGESTAIINPKLRDVEWILSYGWLTARGFSGFEDDPDYTCHRLIKKMEEGKKFNTKEERTFAAIEYSVLKPDGTPKKYIEAKEYLYNTHERAWGNPLYLNDKKDFFVLGPRGFGKSYFCGNAVIGHEYNFFGKRKYDNTYLVNPSPIEIFVGSAIAAKSAELLKKFEMTQNYLQKSIGAWGSGEDFIPGFFYNNFKGSLKSNNADSPYEHSYKEKIGREWVSKGSGTKIIHGVYTAENPQAAVGTRPTTMVIEEVGLLGPLLSVVGANQTCMIRRTKFGSAFYIGTSGNMEKIVESKIVFEDAKSYNLVEYPDLWEGRRKAIGLFLPGYYVDSDFKDENGNTNLEDSLSYELHQRSILEKASTSDALYEYMMARPLVPSEMFLSNTGNTFPVPALRARSAKVDVEGLFKLKASIGYLEYSDIEEKEVKFVPDLKNVLKPITTLNLDSMRGDLNGCVVIYEHPPENIPNPTFRRSLYKVVYDPVKDDGGGQSLACILVYKGFADDSWEGGMQDTIVAEYIGRYDRVNDMHEIAIKLALYYNSKIMPEVNIPDFVRYCRMKKRYHMLQPSPWIAISKAVKDPKKKYDVGVVMTNNKNSGLSVHCEQLIRQWLLNERHSSDEGVNKTTVDYLYSPRVLEELIHYNRTDNFDAISALKLLALWISQENEEPIKQEEQGKKYEELDEFLARKVSNKRKRNPYYGY